jgi:hypothetical protein
MKKTVSIALVLLIIVSTVSMFSQQVKAHDLPSELHLGYYITPDDPDVINVAKIVCGPDFGKSGFWTVRSNVENLYHWVAGSVPHGIPKHIEYMRDQDYWGVADYWQLSNTTLDLGHGDDEDQAILLASLIKAAGVSHWRVRIVKYGVFRLEFPWWGLGLVKIEKERIGYYYAVEVYDISSHPTNLWYHDWWTPLHPIAQNLLGWPLPFASCEWLGNAGFENPICAKRLKPEEYFYERVAGDPMARFTHYPETPSVDETVKFDASISTPDGGYVWKHCWDFGDGTLINVTNGHPIPPPPVFHAFESEENFTVTLTVFDTEARSNSTSKVIEVKGLPDTNPPDITIISPENKTYKTDTIDLQYTVSEPTSWVGCTIDDGKHVSNVTITGNTTLTYLTPGSHNVQLYANDTSGNMGKSSKMYFTIAPQYTLKVYSTPTGVTFTVDGISRTTPWVGTYYEGTSVSLIMPETHDGYVWTRWLEDGDTNRMKTVTMNTNITLTGMFTYVPPPKPVGGKATPINMGFEPEIQTSWIWLTTIILPLLATVVYVKLRKKKQ